jgi:peptidyl-prolyl cis-trans isomerase-like 3
VIHGYDVLDALEKVPVDEKHRPTKEVTIKGVTIHANPLAQSAIQ